MTKKRALFLAQTGTQEMQILFRSVKSCLELTSSLLTISIHVFVRDCVIQVII